MPTTVILGSSESPTAQRSGMRLRSATASRPVQASLRAVPPASLDVLEGVPGIRHEDDRVEFTASDFREAYDGATALATVARSGYQSARSRPCSCTPL